MQINLSVSQNPLLSQITDIDDVHSTVELSVWICMVWKDSYIQKQQEIDLSLLSLHSWQDILWYPRHFIHWLTDIKMLQPKSK